MLNENRPWPPCPHKKEGHCMALEGEPKQMNAICMNEDQEEWDCRLRARLELQNS